MSKRTSASVVTVLAGGLGLSLSSACNNGSKTTSPPPSSPDAIAERPTENPPPPPPEPTPNAGLPRWEEVESGHPKGATNPPRPVLVVMADGPRCWKEWVGGMMPPDPAVVETGGRVITEESQTQGTEVLCPMRQAQSVLDKTAARGEEK